LKAGKDALARRIVDRIGTEVEDPSDVFTVHDRVSRSIAGDFVDTKMFASSRPNG